MTHHRDDAIDPFRDPLAHSPAPPQTQDAEASLTLQLGRDVSLTLGTDSLVVLDEGFAATRRRRPRFCGLVFGQNAPLTQAVPYHNILWAELTDFELSITYAHAVSKQAVRPAYITYGVEKDGRSAATAWIARLLDRAYGRAQRQKRIKVLVNPFGGKGSAQKYWARDISPIFAAARCTVDDERTRYKGHATEIAEQLDTSAWDVIASCSGDGLPYEVFNGLGKKPDAAKALADVAVVQLPCGTGNAMSLNLNGTLSPSLAALAVVKGLRTPLDLVSVTQGSTRTLSFLSQSFGIVAETDLGTENVRWMGSARFTYGFLVRILGKTVYPCDVAVKVVDDSKVSIRARYRQQTAGSVPLAAADGASNDSTEHHRTNETPGPGLPPLQFGTVQDPLPPDWHLTPYPTMGNFYSGNMSYMSPDANFFQAALPSDGCLDLVCIDGHISRLESLKILAGAGNGKLFDIPHVTYRKVAGYRIIPHKRLKGKKEVDGYISIDGEHVPFEPFQVEVHQGLGTVLSRSGRWYEAPPL